MVWGGGVLGPAARWLGGTMSSIQLAGLGEHGTNFGYVPLRSQKALGPPVFVIHQRLVLVSLEIKDRCYKKNCSKRRLSFACRELS